jgi:hypothetical protein
MLSDLPKELHPQIFSHLDYLSWVALSQTNKFFRSAFLCVAETWPKYYPLQGLTIAAIIPN